MSNGTITMTGAEYDALAGKIAALESELAKLKGEYEWVASINTALDESNQSAWDELARLRAGQEPVAYITGQFAGRCVIEAINRAAVLPTGMALYTTPQPSAVPEGEGLEVVGYASECGLAVLRGLPITGAVQIKAAAHKVYEVPLCRLSDHQRAIAELREECERLRKEKSARQALSISLIDEARALRTERDTLRQQRDKLAGLLRDISSSESRGLDWAKQIYAALAEVNK